MTAAATKLKSTASEKPILFSGELVRAILSGSKTQMRRIFSGLTPPECEGDHSCAVEDGFAKFHLNGRLAMHEGEWAKCRYGQPGDRLWVRESFFDTEPHATAPLFRRAASRFAYRADGEFIGCHRWKSPIFMPRTASRLLLEITSVRVERLQAITEADAIAEGIELVSGDYNRRDFSGCWRDYSGQREYWNSPIDSFHSAWDSINGKRAPWASNPWVWRIEFNLVEVGQ